MQHHEPWYHSGEGLKEEGPWVPAEWAQASSQSLLQQNLQQQHLQQHRQLCCRQGYQVLVRALSGPARPASPAAGHDRLRFCQQPPSLAET